MKILQNFGLNFLFKSNWCNFGVHRGKQ